MEETKKLAQFISELSYDDFPGDVIARAKESLMDYVGACLFSSEMEWSRIVIDFVNRLKSTEEATIIARKEKTSTPLAALANGTMGHGFELDDVHDQSLTHPGAVVIPAAMAIGEREGIDGKLFITSIVLGYEVMARVGMVMGSSHILRGFHPTATNGTIASAAVAAKILRLNREQILNALGVAGSFASGLMEFSQSGGMIKRVHAGYAAQNGINAALLAQGGLTGPSTVLEGKYGYFKAFSDKYDLKDIVPDKHDYQIKHISLKPYACCRMLHSVIDAIKFIQGSHHLPIPAIKTIDIGGNEKLVTQHEIYEPESIMSAQYSLPFVSSLALMRNIDDPGIFNDEILKDREILAMCKKVRSFKDPEIDRVFPEKFGAKVILNLENGQKVEKTILNPKGHPENPLSSEEVRRKFGDLSKNVLTPTQIERILDHVSHLEKLENILTLSKLFRN